MTLGIALLRLTGVAFVGFGLGFIAAPAEVAEMILGVAPSAPSALIDMRATYGGMSLGAGLFVGLCASRPLWVRPGLIAGLLIVASIGVARAIGVVVDGQPNGFMLAFLAFEVIAVVLYAIALRASASTPEGLPSRMRSRVS